MTLAEFLHTLHPAPRELIALAIVALTAAISPRTACMVCHFSITDRSMDMDMIDEGMLIRLEPTGNIK